MPAIYKDIAEDGRNLSQKSITAASNDDSSPWQEFAERFGVSNIVPIAQKVGDVVTKLNPGSVGKVPSVYNSRGELVGFKDWQKRRVTLRNINTWEHDSRYGLGVILGQPLPAGGVAVCIDVDTESREEQNTVERVLREWLGDGVLPRRVRDNSARRAYVLRVTGAAEPIKKRILKMRDDPITGKPVAVEILGQGQQFVAWGRHPSGALLEWLDSDVESLTAERALPDMSDSGQSVTVEELEEIIERLYAELPVLSLTSQASRQRAEGSVAAPADEVAEYLDAEGWTLSVGSEGERRIRSPFAEEYTTEQGDTDSSVVYYSAGTGKNKDTGAVFEQGHFVSLHASDAERTDQDFLNAIGFIASQFEDLPAEPEGAPLAPRLERDKAGLALPTASNILAALLASEWVGYGIAYDTFTGGVMFREDGSWRPQHETDNFRIRTALERHGFRPVGKELIRDAINEVARRHTIDTAQEWLNGLEWDGVPRIAGFFERYFNTHAGDDATDAERQEMREYARAVSLYTWTALAGRVLSPGIQADMMPLLVGDQGARKTSGLKALSPNLDYYSELSFKDDDDNNSRKIRGVLVAEFGEMHGVRARDVESIKALITRTVDKWVPKYQEMATLYARRCVLFGTSNEHELLADLTGNRRFLPMQCGAVDVEAIQWDRDQLWAEAAALFRTNGVMWRDAERLARARLSAFQVREVITDTVLAWLSEADLTGRSPAARGYVTVNEVLIAISSAVSGLQINQVGKNRIATALQELGYLRKQKRIDGKQKWVYVKDSAGE